MKKLFLPSLIAFAFVSMSLAQLPVDSVRIYYRQGHRNIDTLYKDNRTQLSHFLQSVRKAHETNAIGQLVISSYASPDGLDKYNRRLSVYRAESMRDYLLRHTEVPENLIKEYAVGIAWDELRHMVADLDKPWRDEVLRIIDHTPVFVYDEHNRIVDGRKKQLMDLQGGIPYKYMYEHLFPELRNSTVVSLRLQTTENKDSDSVAANAVLPVNDETDNIHTDTAAATQGTTATQEIAAMQRAAATQGAVSTQKAATEQQKPAEVPTSDIMPTNDITPLSTENDLQQRLAIKTNLLYDAILMPSLEVEYRINERWSVNLEGDMAWWKNDGKHKYYQLATISPEGRYWFKTRKPWHGHYLGAFTGFSWYDLENGNKGYRGEAQMVGLSYGYMWPIARRLSLEAGIGAGFLHTRYEEYLPKDGHYLYQQTKQTNYFGPLKVKFALVWRLWNEKKEGGIR